jgi:hypothetical protein
MTIYFRHRGNFNKTEKLFSNALKLNIQNILLPYAIEGVRALASATPINTGLTSESWGYEIKVSKRGYSIVWTNSNVSNGIPIVILLQYGHGTGNGGYVQGRDFINPAIQPIFDKILENISKEIENL